MPEVEALANVDPDEFWESCSSREKKDLIEIIVGEALEDRSGIREKFLECLRENFPEIEREINPLESQSLMHSEFLDSLDKLGKAYYSLPNEDIEIINNLAKRF